MNKKADSLLEFGLFFVQNLNCFRLDPVRKSERAGVFPQG